MKKIAVFLAILMVAMLAVSCTTDTAESSGGTSEPATSKTESTSSKPQEDTSKEESMGDYSQPEPEPTLLYVNAFNGTINNSVSGQFHETPNAFTEGAGTLVTDEYTGSLSGFAWAGVAIFKPTDEEGVYEVVYSSGSDGTDKDPADMVIPEGGFLYSANTGNDWPALVEQNKDLIAQIDSGEEEHTIWWYTANKDYPNFTTPEITNSTSAAGSLFIGAKATLVGIDLENGTIEEDFGAYISIINIPS